MNQLLLRLHQLARALDERYVPDVHSEGVDRKNAENRQTQLRSRALAAMAACIVARIPDREAAARVTDYFHDDGIDGFAVSAAGSDSPTIHLVQAKWSAAGTHNFTVSETKKLVDGFAKLRDWQQLHLDNRLRDHRDEIYPAMNKTGARVVLIFATSGYNKVSPTTRIETQQAIERITQNRFPVDSRYLILEDFINELVATAERRGVTVSAPLLRDRRVDEHYPALQGTISAAELGQWYLEHGRAIFDDNVRVEMDSDVNKQIFDCLLQEPENFWYFNNGVTALCEDWKPAPVGGREVPYQFVDLRIVNGAQTVSSIGRAMQADRNSAAKAQVPIRFVALKTMPPGFGARIAYATNRANPMLPRDFLAMDHVQQRLRDEFTLTWGLKYAIRANDDLLTDGAGCSVLEAAIAMACGRHDVATLIEAKKDISSLWQTQGELYRKLFDDGTSAVEVWRRVQILRMITAELHRSAELTSQRAKAVAVFGDLVIAHVVFRQLGDEGIDDFGSNWRIRQSSIGQHARTALHALVARVDTKLASEPTSKSNFKGVAKLLEHKKWLARQIQDILMDRSGMLILDEDRESDARWPSEPEFRLPIRSNQRAMGRPCDGGFLVQVGSRAAARDYSSLSTLHLRHRRNLRDSLGFVEDDGFLRLTRDALFDSPSQAAAVLQGHSVNGADGWITTNGMTYNQVMKGKKGVSRP